MNAANDIRVLSWHPSLQPHFEQLNKHWISKYFRLEQVDLDVLEHPQEHIIDHGGDIIFVAAGEQVVGTVAYKKLDDETVEMTKMGVDEAFQGRKLGWLLGTAIQQRAAEAGFKKMVLYSNRVLTPAITMYNKLGFREAELEKGGYERCDIKMEIALKAPLQIMEATTAHLPQLAPLFDAYRQHYEQSMDIEGATGYLSERLSRSESVIYIALEGEKIIGFTQLYPVFSSIGMKKAWILNDLYVDAAHRRKGAARALIAASRRLGESSDARYIMLQTHITNTNAQALYESAGFRRDDEFYYYYLSI